MDKTWVKIKKQTNKSVLLSQGEVAQINCTWERQAVVAGQALAVVVATDADFKNARVSEDLR